MPARSFSHGTDHAAQYPRGGRRSRLTISHIEELISKLQPYSPVIQWGAVSQKWHVTLLDGPGGMFTSNTIMEALRDAVAALNEAE